MDHRKKLAAWNAFDQRSASGELSDLKRDLKAFWSGVVDRLDRVNRELEDLRLGQALPGSSERQLQRHYENMAAQQQTLSALSAKLLEANDLLR